MRIAVLGCGSIGKRHLKNLLALGGHELLPYDSNADARAHVENVIGIKASSSLEDLWHAKPEAALICTPPDSHLPLALEAARRRVHLFIEKPIAASASGLEELVSEVSKRKLTAMVACNMRFHPGPARVKELLEQGSIGAVISGRIQTGSYLPDWRPSTDYRKGYSASRAQGGGAILDCIHELDLALWYFGPATVLAAVALPAAKLGIEVEGLAEILLQHASGVLSSVHLNFVQRDYRRGCQIIGEQGTIYWDFDQPSVEMRSGAGLERRYPLDANLHVNQLYVDELGHFLHCVEKNEPVCASLDQGIAALKIALRARELALGESSAQPA